jgi:hypothetical protein
MQTQGNEPPTPILFLYSRTDRIVRAASVEAWVEHLREESEYEAELHGEMRVIQAHEFPRGQHVAIFWTEFDTYREKASAFIQECLQRK